MRAEITAEMDKVKKIVRRNSATDITAYLTYGDVIKGSKRFSRAITDYFDAYLPKQAKAEFIAKINKDHQWSGALKSGNYCCREYRKGNFYLLQYPGNTPTQGAQMRSFSSISAMGEFLIGKYKIIENSAQRGAQKSRASGRASR